MSSSFFSLPREVRDQIYELALFPPQILNPWSYFAYDRRLHLNNALLRRNKTIHREASSLLYGQFQFDFTQMNAEEYLSSFLKQIGPTNAHHIRHVLIGFPEFLPLKLDNIVLEDYSVGILANLRSSCPNLSTLTTDLTSTSQMEYMFDGLHNDQIITEAIELINTHFRSIPSLKQIKADFYEIDAYDHLRREMESHGWTVIIAERRPGS